MILKRATDIVISAIGLVLLSPFFVIAIIAIWLYDFENPFYIATRVGKNGKTFNMVKLRSMSVSPTLSRIESTANDDNRITPIGKLIRKYKLDEFIQLWNVFLGEMSLVGPRPNTVNGVGVYTDREKLLLSIKPGITDIASIIFSDEGDILNGHKDPDLAYDQLIRPWKSRLGLAYIENSSFLFDLKIIFFTAVAIFSKKNAVIWVNSELRKIGVSEETIKVSMRKEDLKPSSPPV